MSYQTDRERYGARPAPHGGRTGAAYRAAVGAVRERARHGEPCYFYGQLGYEDCPGGFNWGLHYQDPMAFTAHHKARLMDGGAAVVGAADMAPAHRSCNSRDGLRAQNQRRGLHRGASIQGPTEQGVHRVSITGSNQEYNSREW